MTSPQQRLWRDVVAWGGAVAVLAALALLLPLENIPIRLGISLLIAVVVYLGFYFILNPKTQAEIQAIETQNQTEYTIGQIKFKIWEIRKLLDQITEQNVKNRVQGICTLGDEIIVELTRQQPEIATVTRMFDMFGQVQQILKGYADLVTGKVKVTPEKFQELKTRVETEVLDQIDKSLHDFARDLSKDDIQQLEASMEILEMTLKFEKLS
jgi:5-bromo-4-chloroindolyl phosphate hydrolysis protein